jgi:hypothetical protein
MNDRHPGSGVQVPRYAQKPQTSGPIVDRGSMIQRPLRIRGWSEVTCHLADLGAQMFLTIQALLSPGTFASNIP